MLAVRRYLLPNEDDSELNVARALWLHKQLGERQETIIANAISKAFSRK